MCILSCVHASMHAPAETCALCVSATSVPQETHLPLERFLEALCVLAHFLTYVLSDFLTHLQETHLPFEGFLEALCRLGGMAALPTDDEISAAGCSDAGDYLNYLRAQDENQYKQLKAERAAEWGSSPKQPLSRCVDHLCAVMIRKAEAGGGAQSSKDLQLSTKEVHACMHASAYARIHVQGPPAQHQGGACMHACICICTHTCPRTSSSAPRR